MSAEPSGSAELMNGAEPMVNPSEQTRKSSKIMPSFVSLFSGCGGFDLGFIQAGFNCIAAFDIDPAAVNCYRINISDHIQVLDLSQNNVPNIILKKGPDVVIAGPPCQGFSTIGKRRFTDPRNNLLVRSVDLAISMSPKAIVIENVYAAKLGRHIRLWNNATRRLQAAGYAVNEYTCLAHEVGVPQTRKRLVIVAIIRGHLPSYLPKSPCASLRSLLLIPPKTPNHDPIKSGSHTDNIIAPFIKQGMKLSNVRGGSRYVATWDIPEVFGNTTSKERAFLKAIRSVRRTL